MKKPTKVISIANLTRGLSALRDTVRGLPMGGVESVQALLMAAALASGANGYELSREEFVEMMGRCYDLANDLQAMKFIADPKTSKAELRTAQVTIEAQIRHTFGDSPKSRRERQLNTYRRSGYLLILLGAFNLALDLFRWRMVHTVSAGGIFVTIMCFAMGAYWLRKGWSDHV